MRNIKVAFYKKSKTAFGKLIRFQQYRLQRMSWVHARYSHVELFFDDSWWYSSSELDKGVRAKKIKPKFDHWDYIDLAVTEEEYQKVRSWCESKCGAKYNFIGIFFAQIFKTMWFLGREDYFCSEFVTKALQEIKLLCGVDGVMINPAKLHKLLQK